MKTNEQNNTREQEKKFTEVAPNAGGDQKKPVEEPTRKAGEEGEGNSKS